MHVDRNKNNKDNDANNNGKEKELQIKQQYLVERGKRDADTKLH